MNVTLVENQLVIQKPGGIAIIGHVDEFPLTFEGQAEFNVQNIMAAVAATYALGVSEDQIYTGLVSFNSTVGQSPGRINMMDIGEFKVVIDYGHNPAAIHATGKFFCKLMPGQKIRLAAGVGDRRKEDIKDYGRAVAQYFDQVVLCDSAPRQRPLGETVQLVKEGMIEGGLATSNIEVIYDELDATQRALEMANPGDLVVIQPDNITQVTQVVMDYKKNYLSQQKCGKKN